MTHVSKKILPKDATESLTKEFTTFLALVQGKNTHTVFETFFTKSEQEMFIKRFAVILLLASGLSNYKIAQTLQMSESTVAVFSLKYEAGMYKTLLSIVKKEKFDVPKFLNVIELLLSAGLPPRTKDRWKSVFPKK